MLNENQLQAARGWIRDCATSSLELEAIADLTDGEVISIIKTQYEGGVSQFLNDSEPITSFLADREAYLNQLQRKLIQEIKSDDQNEGKDF